MKSLAILAAVFLCASLVVQAKLERRQEQVDCAAAGLGWIPSKSPPASCFAALPVVATITDFENLTPEQTSALMAACNYTCIGDLCSYLNDEELWDCVEGLNLLCKLPSIGQTQHTCDGCSVLGRLYPEDIPEQCSVDLATVLAVIPFVNFTDNEAQALDRGCNDECFGAICSYYRDEDANECADELVRLCTLRTNMSLTCDASPPTSPTPTPTTDGGVAILTGAVPAFLGLAALLGAFFRA